MPPSQLRVWRHSLWPSRARLPGIKQRPHRRKLRATNARACGARHRAAAIRKRTLMRKLYLLSLLGHHQGTPPHGPFRDFSLCLLILRGEPFSVEEDIEMDAKATELQAAENTLTQLMAELSRATEKAQEGVAKIASKPATATSATAETQSTTSS